MNENTSIQNPTANLMNSVYIFLNVCKKCPSWHKGVLKGCVNLVGFWTIQYSRMHVK